MIFNRYVLFLTIALLVSVASLALVLMRLDPFVDGQLAITLFFVSLFFAISSLTSLVGYIIRVTLYRSELFLNHFNVSLRQGVVISIGIISLLGLQAIKTLTWWNGIMIVAICFMLELYFVAKE